MASSVPAVKDEIYDTLGFTVNVGVANSKVCAKMASDFEKPNKVHTLFDYEVKKKMWPLKVDDGWVHVSLNADYQYFYIRVEDSGIGIPEESQNKIFERFYRVDKARSRETGGTGLGLAIVRNIILLHHGTIKVHSEENIGTTFTMRVPLNYVEVQ